MWWEEVWCSRWYDIKSTLNLVKVTLGIRKQASWKLLPSLLYTGDTTILEARFLSGHMIITWSTTSGVVFFIWPSEGIYTLAISHKIPAVYVSVHWTRVQETLNVKLSDSLNYPEHLKILCLAQGHLGSVAEGREGELCWLFPDQRKAEHNAPLHSKCFTFYLLWSIGGGIRIRWEDARAAQ